jgi:hypothetical protein
VLDAFAGYELGNNNGLFTVKIGWDELENRRTDDLIVSVSKEASGGGIPAHDDAIKVFADDGVIRGFDEGLKQRGIGKQMRRRERNAGHSSDGGGSVPGKG